MNGGSMASRPLAHHQAAGSASGAGPEVLTFDQQHRPEPGPLAGNGRRDADHAAANHQDVRSEVQVVRDARIERRALVVRQLILPEGSHLHRDTSPIVMLGNGV